MEHSKSTPLSEQELYTQVLNKLKNTTTDFTNILNSFIEPVFERDELLAMLLKFARPNEVTHLSLINCHLRINNYEEVMNILSKQKKNLSVGGLIIKSI